jgi:hypothetical protein
MMMFVDQYLITTSLDTFIEFMYHTNEKNILIFFSLKEAIIFWGRADFGGSVGKGKQTKFYFRPNSIIEENICTYIFSRCKCAFCKQIIKCAFTGFFKVYTADNFHHTERETMYRIEAKDFPFCEKKELLEGR